jgi:hypothetical protein
MKINELALTESVHDVQDHDWQTLLSLVSDRLKRKLRLEPDREFAYGNVDSLLRKIVNELTLDSEKWRDKKSQIVRLLMPYVIKEMDYELETQALTIGLDLSMVRDIIKVYQEYIPAIKQVLEKHRATIVKKLKEFAEEQPGMLALDLGTLKKLGLDWPELKQVIYPAYETYLLNKFDRQYNIVTLYSILMGMKELGYSIDEFPRLKKLIENFKYQLLFHNQTHVSDMVWARVEYYQINVKRFKALGIDWPELADPDGYARTVFDEQKENTVRQMLNNMKQSVPEYPLKDIAALRSIGVDWPELDVMERSLNRDVTNKRQINEAQQSPFDATLVDQLSKLLPKLLRTRFEYLNNRFYFGPFIDFMFDVVNAKFSEAKKQRVFELLEPVVLESLDSYIASMKDPTFAFRHFMDYFEKLLNLARYTDYDYSAVIDRNKASILKMVLASVRVYMNEPDNIGHWSRYQSYVNLLKLITSWGLTWPELEKIVRSLASERYVTMLDRTFMPQSVVPELVAAMKRDRVRLDQLTQSAQEKIESAKDRFVNRPYFNFRWRDDVKFELDNGLLAFYQDLKQLGFTWPEVDQYLAAGTTRERAETQKRQIVSSMLLALKNGEWDGVPGAVKGLRDMGVDWSELDTIDRSVNSLTNKQIMETAMDDKTYQHHAASISAHLAAGRPVQALRYMGERYITIDKVKPDLRNAIEASKATIIRDLLKQFAFQQERDIDVFFRHISWINKVNLDWPELAVLNRSVNNLRNQKLNETDTDDIIKRHHSANIAFYLANSEPLQALRYMGERDITVDQLDSDLRTELESQKADAVRTMLKLLTLNIFRFGRFLEYVNKTGLDWPELAVINRSFDAEYAAREDEFARHRNY